MSAEGGALGEFGGDAEGAVDGDAGGEKGGEFLGEEEDVAPLAAAGAGEFEDEVLLLLDADVDRGEALAAEFAGDEFVGLGG